MHAGLLQRADSAAWAQGLQQKCETVSRPVTLRKLPACVPRLTERPSALLTALRIACLQERGLRPAKTENQATHRLHRAPNGPCNAQQASCYVHECSRQRTRAAHEVRTRSRVTGRATPPTQGPEAQPQSEYSI